MDAKNTNMVRAKSMMKSKTFKFDRSQSMEQSSLPPPKTITAGGNFSPIDFPTSPQLLYGEEINHQSHPEHPLSKIVLADQFICAGCKEDGAGTRFSCQLCGFHLHDFCALEPRTLKSHPFHYQHKLSFNLKPAKSGKSRCDTCGKPVKGYSFQCKACSFQMHPCCTMLPEELSFPTHPHALKLLLVSLPGKDSAFTCGECKRKRSGRVYRCTDCDYHLHAICAKPIVNGLYDYGIKDHEKPSVLGTAARLASQAVIGFIEGLIEGFGQGVGEALVQNMVKGRCYSRKSRDE